MKQYLFVFMLLLLKSSGFCQAPATATFMEPYPLEVTANKTTNLVFPFAIKSVDRGSADILVQKAKSIDTILQVKAGKENFRETNLSVVTTDGKLYSFLLHYAASPQHLNFVFGKDTIEKNEVQSEISFKEHEHLDNEADFLRNAKFIATRSKFIHGVKESRYLIRLQLEGIYTKNGNLYFQLQLKNASNLPYPVEMLRFSLRDKKLSKRTSQQEIELMPIYKYGNANAINASVSNNCVIVFPPFTIANSKYLVITMSEKNGGRTMNLRIRDKQILQARNIN